MKIIVIDNYDSFVYNLVRYIQENIDGTVEVYRNDKVDPEALKSADGILLSPGPGVPKDAGMLLDIIDQFHAKIPLLGVCLGHQAIAEYFGCTLIRQEKVYHGKSSLIEHSNEDSLFKSIPLKTEVGRYHSWSVHPNVSDEVSITAATESGEVMAIRHSNYPISGVQFHPESILTPHGKTMIKNWIKSITKNELS